MNMKEVYCVQWRSRTTGTVGYGTGRFTKEKAKSICDDMNEHDTNMRYTIKRVRGITPLCVE